MSKKKEAAAPQGVRRFFVPITRVHEDGDRVFVEGYATRDIVDDRGTAFDHDGATEAFTEWTDTFERMTGGESLGNIREMHQKVAAGKVIGWRPDDQERGQYIVTEIVDEAAKEKCRKRVYTGFSIGANPLEPPRVVKRDGKSVPTYHKFRIAEVSLVDAGGTPGTEFTLVRRAQDPPAASAEATPASVTPATATTLRVPRSLRFNAERFTPDQAAEWARAHEFRVRQVPAVSAVGTPHVEIEMRAAAAFAGDGNPQVVRLATGVDLVTGELDPASPAALLARILRGAEPAILERVRSQGGPIIASLNALANLVQAIDSALYGGFSIEGPTEQDRAAAATLTIAAESILDFCADAFRNQLASMTTGAQRDAATELERFTQLPGVLTTAQLERLMTDDDMRANVGAMHEIGHALCDATMKMGGECQGGVCRAGGDPAAGEGDGATANEGKGGDEPPPKKKDDDEEERTAAAPAVTAQAPVIPPTLPAARAGFPSPAEVATRHAAGVPSPAPAAAATATATPPAPSAPAAAAPAIPTIARVSTGTDPVLEAIAKVQEQLTGLATRMDSSDAVVKRIAAQPAPVGRAPAAPASKVLSGTGPTAPSADPAALSAELQRMAETITDPASKAAIVLRAAALVAPGAPNNAAATS